MKASDLAYGQSYTLSLQAELDADFGQIILKTHEVRLTATEASPALLQYNKPIWAVKPAGDPKHRDGRQNKTILEKILADNLPRVCSVIHAENRDNKTVSVRLEIRTFPSKLSWTDEVDFGVDDKIVKDFRKKQRSLESVEKVIEWLTSKFFLPFPPGKAQETRVFISVPPNTENAQLSKFRLYGDRYAIDIAKQPDGKLRVERLVEVKNTPKKAIWLAEGQFKFCDMTVAGQVRGMAETSLDQIIRTAGSYLNIWQEYNQLEREGILRRIREFGWLEYKAIEPRPYGVWRFQLHQDKDLSSVIHRMKDGEEVELEAATGLPAELRDNEFSIREKKFRRAEFVGVCVDYSQKYKTLDLRPHSDEDSKPPPKRGVIFISLSGDEKRLQRREDAKDHIASARCPMPQLGLLLEEQPISAMRRNAVQALSASAREHFGGQPTERQVKALELALNTPDIVLVQGPPGTGKTRVIAALQARLAELGETADGIGGQTLLTSYQHDAVENAAERSIVFGLPAVKIGKRWGDTEDFGNVDRWREERINAVRAKLAAFPETSVSQAWKKVREKHLAYISGPLPNQDTANLLQEVLEWSQTWLPGDLSDRLSAMQHDLQFKTSPDAGADDLDLVRKAVRGLRTQAQAFSDDGPRNAYKVLQRLKNAQIDLNDSDAELLQRVVDWESSETPDFLVSLANLQGRLLDRLQPKEIPADKPRANMEVAGLLAEVVDVLYNKARTLKGGEAEVLEEYRQDLENSEQVRETIRHYTAVLAATCQQAVGYQMSQAKNENTVFNSVIVDEAARANPLDLFIPMAKAERRIVLVGDHRQLPHILEPDVERELESSVQDETREALKKSLFERLFTQLREREKKDGVRRVITLDKQYRMHPVLGDFVSKTFYAPYGEGFDSGRPAEDFAHELNGFAGKVAAWVDIPFKHGGEKSGKSKSRPAEAKWIADNLKKLMQHRPDFSFGVISFYAAQVDEVFRALSTSGITTQTESGNYRIADAWQRTEDSEERVKERLRIGTVDAFQGKEFDVVILSMTRSNQLPDDADDDAAKNRLWRRKYGHLMLENRLCVAMSRQQRLLIVVGDDDMLQTPCSAQAIPALLAFKKLCEGEHGCIHSF